MSSVVHKQVDKMEAYVDWREACLRVSDTYCSWSRATGRSAGVAFARYVAALDREERAAEMYANRWMR
jgi:hypothetical protein